ncbi:hypothetical protein [Sphingomonas sp. Ant H11]|uniref:hypothetical protein n=1 Tax=Sphingomonas sp. Ant H11 TaxID=1564113 RepID=UPI0018CF9B62|nr:hypothetical protein [Sphingomonas sp. Ant H11]
MMAAERIMCAIAKNVEKCAGPGLIGGDIARGEIVELVDEAVEGEAPDREEEQEEQPPGDQQRAT